MLLLVGATHRSFCQVNDPFLFVGPISSQVGLNIKQDRFLLDFTSNVVSIEKLNLDLGMLNSSKQGSTASGTVICDSMNNILFFSNGYQLRYPNNKIVLGADSLFWYWPNEGSEVPYYLVKLTDSIFYQIHSLTPGQFSANCTNFTCMDHYFHKFGLNSQTNEVKVLNKQVNFLSSWNIEISQPVRHANGRDWWFYHLNGTNFLEPFKHQLWKISPDTLQKTTVEYVHTNPFNRMGRGLSWTQKGFSLDGKKYYWCETPGCLIFDFDRCSGILSNQKVIQVPPDESYENNTTYFGAQLSPKNRYLYATFTHNIELPGDNTQINDYLLQYDLTAQNITASVDTIAVSDSLDNPGYQWYNKGQEFLSLSYAPDGLLWLPSGLNNYSLIQYPDSAGQACGFISRWIDNIPFGSTDFRSANHRLGPVDGSICDTLGINNDPKAQYFWKSADCLTVKFRNTSWHEPTTFLWDFGDGTSSTEREPSHTYVTKGKYEVCLVASNQYGAHTFCRDVDLVLECGSVGIASPKGTNESAYAELFPNPTSGPLQLKYRLNAGRYDGVLRMYDLTGREVLTRGLRVHETSYLFDISHLPTGLYFWSLGDGTGSIGSGKVVKAE
jgi:PKD domain/Secretion system C-terminal sorting domain